MNQFIGRRNLVNMYTLPLPFEFRALEVALEAASASLDSQAAELKNEAYPLLDELTSKINTLNIERVHGLKSRLAALTKRVQKVRDEIQRLMDDERSKNESVGSSESATENIEEVEMLLEAYIVVIDSTLNKLTSLKKHIDDTEDFVYVKLDNVRNQLIRYALLLTIAIFVVTIFGVVAGIFDTNFPIKTFDEPTGFKWVLIITGVCGAVIFGMNVEKFPRFCGFSSI